MKKLLLILTIAAFLTGSAYAGTIQVSYPNGGESLCKSKTCTITWTSSGITTPLRIVLIKGDVRLGDIVLGLPAGTTSYSWTVGNYIGGTAPVGNDYKIRVRIDTAADPGTEADFSDAVFSIKVCMVFDPHKYKLVEKIRCKFPPGCPGCPPEFDLNKLRERIGDPAEELKLVLLKNGRQILELGSFGKGRGLPNSIGAAKLSEADLGLLKSGKGKFALGLLGADNKLRGTYALEVR